MPLSPNATACLIIVQSGLSYGRTVEDLLA